MAMDVAKIKYNWGRLACREMPPTGDRQKRFPANAVVCLSNGELSMLGAVLRKLNFVNIRLGRHPERSRPSGGAKDPARAGGDLDTREIPRPAGKDAGLRDDVGNGRAVRWEKTEGL